MSARAAAETRTTGVERHSRLGRGRNGRREGGSQDQITERKPARPRRRPSAVLPRPAHALSRTPFCQNPGKNRSNGPGKTAQLDQQAFEGDQGRPAETSNHHLGFPEEPKFVLQLTDIPKALPSGSSLSFRPLRGGGPGNRSSRFCLYLRVFLFQIERIKHPQV